jgi:hypothetical protein
MPSSPHKILFKLRTHSFVDFQTWLLKKIVRFKTLNVYSFGRKM